MHAKTYFISAWVKSFRSFSITEHSLRYAFPDEDGYSSFSCVQTNSEHSRIRIATSMIFTATPPARNTEVYYNAPCQSEKKQTLKRLPRYAKPSKNPHHQDS